MKTYRIGTRGSLLALTQTNLIKAQLEKKTGDKFDIVPIKTAGDIQTNAPLWQLEGKDFFTKELDQALLLKEVDMVVHSYKDLGSERPDGIALAAITKREFAHDILLIKKSTIPQLKTLNNLIVGTSSPRRITNIEKSLHEFLPYGRKDLKISCQMLRGNIHTRVEKLQKGDYHAIVLAMAGPERLALHPDSLPVLEKLLQGLQFMILPPSTFPPAASQGALALECREVDNELREKLKILEDAHTVEEVSRERVAFQAYGGGCHLAVGIHVRKIGPYFLQSHQGRVGGREIHQYELQATTPFPAPVDSKAFLGLPKKKSSRNPDQNRFLFDEIIIKKEIPSLSQTPKKLWAHFFITSSYVLPRFAEIYGGGFLWAAGTKTLQELIKRGHWVHGSADSLGYGQVESLVQSKALQVFFREEEKNGGLPESLTWKVLTNDLSQSSLGECLPCYTREIRPPGKEFQQNFAALKVYFWSSFFQFTTYQKFFPDIMRPSTQHCCGIGKTFEEFQRHGINVLPFVHQESFIQWIHQ